MGVDTKANIKGYVNHEDIFEYIKENWDKNAVNRVAKDTYDKLEELKFPYKLNEHSEDNEHWYIVSGFISFNYKDEERMMFYCYNNINAFESLDYYSKYGLEEMVKAETTHLSLRCWGYSVDIIKELVAHFGGGWIDENDCDGNVYYWVEPEESYVPKEEHEETISYEGWNVVLQELDGDKIMESKNNPKRSGDYLCTCIRRKNENEFFRYLTMMSYDASKKYWHDVGSPSAISHVILAWKEMEPCLFNDFDYKAGVVFKKGKGF